MQVSRWMLVSSLLLLALALTAQVPDLHPQRTFTPEPIVSFSLELAGAVPPYYSISVESTGDAAYRSSPVPGDMEGDPYITKFVASQAARTRVFELAKKLHYFKGDYDYHKVGLDDELKRMDQMAEEGQLDELQAVAPILHKIADDPQVMHIDKQHAQHLLQLGSASPRQR